MKKNLSTHFTALLLLILMGNPMIAAESKKGIGRVTIDTKLVSLTFDDGPLHNVPQILNILKKHDAKATFFVLGKRVKTQPKVTKQIVTEGSEVANHSYTHANLAELSLKEIRSEVERTQQEVINATGATPTLFRAPYIKYSSEVRQVLEEYKLRE
ncbi:MAG: polysaccharide deacetylase family protein, partial [Planctomycetes bacterium]|nr:polysaccharide deacetylase family protein [Planctomycetota bacterium]